jgi:hypothetical protein
VGKEESVKLCQIFAANLTRVCLHPHRNKISLPYFVFPKRKSATHSIIVCVCACLCDTGRRIQGANSLQFTAINNPPPPPPNTTQPPPQLYATQHSYWYVLKRSDLLECRIEKFCNKNNLFFSFFLRLCNLSFVCIMS